MYMYIYIYMVLLDWYLHLCPMKEVGYTPCNCRGINLHSNMEYGHSTIISES